jgi:hypothetical protein
LVTAHGNSRGLRSGDKERSKIHREIVMANCSATALCQITAIENLKACYLQYCNKHREYTDAKMFAYEKPAGWWDR